MIFFGDNQEEKFFRLLHLSDLMMLELFGLVLLLELMIHVMSPAIKIMLLLKKSSLTTEVHKFELIDFTSFGCALLCGLPWLSMLFDTLQLLLLWPGLPHFEHFPTKSLLLIFVFCFFSSFGSFFLAFGGLPIGFLYGGGSTSGYCVVIHKLGPFVGKMIGS